MAQFRTPHPWDPRFALPAHVMAEPPGRGTFTTAVLPRRTISGRPANWTGGYALPSYLRGEPSGRGAMHTHWARRKTIPHYLRDALGSDLLTLNLPAEVYSLDGNLAKATTPGTSGDPIAAFGRRAAEYITQTITRVPKDMRKTALKSLLNELEPGLYGKVTALANKYKQRGISPKKAVRKALAEQMSKGFLDEIIRMGASGKPRSTSTVGLGFYGAPAIQTALDGVWSTIKSAITSPIKSGADKVWDWTKDAASKVGDLSCKALGHKATAPIVAGVATAAGSPAAGASAAAAVTAGKGVCDATKGGGVSDQELMTPQNYGSIVPENLLLPIAIGGGALALYLVLK